MITVSRILVLSLILSIYSTSAFSENWDAVRETEQTVIYIDKDSIQAFPNSKIKLAYKTEQKDADFTIKAVTTIDCIDQTSQLHGIHILHPRVGRDEIVNLAEDEQKALPIQGYIQQLYEYVCKTK